MATPLTASLFQPTDFDDFLNEIGLEELSGDDRLALVDMMKQSVEMGIVNRVFGQLSGEKKLELTRLMKTADQSGNEAAVNDFLLREVPDVESLIDEIIADTKNKLRKMTSTLRQDIEEDLLLVRQGQRNQPPPPELVNATANLEGQGMPATLPPANALAASNAVANELSVPETDMPPPPPTNSPTT